ncbi:MULTISPECIES: restriction endonuclease subunit S [Cysteiniphilum]|uniref:restriction endonuclease subunit S n=1 Tax=Cysteiniphilum TaxID=2056696 RepID=UPI00177A7906|nr:MULTISPECIES: restriction endonuclease subunit S [Cysteiniphilum]
MNNKKEKKLTPSLRFPEFEGDGAWSEKELKKLANRITDKNTGSFILRVLTNSATNGVVDQRDYFDKDIANQANLEGYSIVDEGDYVYNPRVSTSAPVGPISKNKLSKGVMSPLYTVFRFKDKKNDFFEHYFKSSHWHHYLRRVSNTGARHDRMSITIDAFEAMPLPLPPTDNEQLKIAACLSSIDEVIELESKKLDVLRDHKKGLMQNLFPAEGETLPKFRFPEFKNDPEWKLSTLNKYLVQTGARNKNLSENRVLSVSNQKGFVLQNEQFIDKKIASDNLSTYRIVHQGEIAYNPSRINVGSIAILDNFNVGIVSPMYVVLKTQSSLNPYYLLYNIATHAFNQKIKTACSGSVRYTLSFEAFCRLEVAIPEKNEQIKISKCIAIIDEIINNQSNKLESLMLHKKGLLQQLFPNPEEING